jgi:hypothetical protein
MRILGERVWVAANVTPLVVTLNIDTKVRTLNGRQMCGRKGYNPNDRGKLSYQPMLTFIAETREHAGGELRNGDHLRSVRASLPPGVNQIYGRQRPVFTAGMRSSPMKSSALYS